MTQLRNSPAPARDGNESRDARRAIFGIALAPLVVLALALGLSECAGPGTACDRGLYGASIFESGGTQLRAHSADICTPDDPRYDAMSWGRDPIVRFVEPRP